MVAALRQGLGSGGMGLEKILEKSMAKVRRHDFPVAMQKAAGEGVRVADGLGG